MPSGKTIFLYFILMVIPLALAYSMIKYGQQARIVLKLASKYTGVSVNLLAPIVILVLFILSVVFGGLLIRSAVHAAVSALRGGKSE